MPALRLGMPPSRILMEVKTCVVRKPMSETMGKELKKVTIYTDGGCIGNPGPGGYGVVLIYGTHRKELYGGFRRTTNNRMEIMAAIVGLRALKTKCAVTVYTDSQYLANAIMKGWAKRWRAKGWMRNEKEKALNPDLWEQLLDLCAQREIEFIWVRGHAGNPENERSDELSMQAARRKGLPPDVGYEAGRKTRWVQRRAAPPKSRLRG